MTLIRALMIRTLAVVAAALMGANLTYQRWIAPLEADRTKSARELATLNEQIQSARKEMWKIGRREQSSAQVRIAVSSMHEYLPADAVPIIWLPPRLKTTLSRFGVSESKIELYHTSAERALPGFERTLWHVAIPKQPSLNKLTDVLLAVAQIEQQEHFVNIQDLEFHSESQEPGKITGFVNLTVFLPESKN